jgi:hypothetical protein
MTFCVVPGFRRDSADVRRLAVISTPIHELRVAVHPCYPQTDPNDVLTKMVNTINVGKSHERLADTLNELDIVAGRGGGIWAVQKVRKVVANA